MPRYTEQEVLAHRKEWQDALRSGKYHQGQQRLVCSVDAEGQYSYCCLGVGAEIAKDQLGLRFDNLAYTDTTAFYAEEWDAELGITGLAYYGLSEIDQNNLIAFNDDYRYSFDRIADEIDKIPVRLYEDDEFYYHNCGDELPNWDEV